MVDLIITSLVLLYESRSASTWSTASKKQDPLLEIAKRLEERALEDAYFRERKLFPNVDFYSGVIYRALGIPENMYTVMFSLGRLPGWIAHWREMHNSGENRIGRPRQIYEGPLQRVSTNKFFSLGLFEMIRSLELFYNFYMISSF